MGDHTEGVHVTFSKAETTYEALVAHFFTAHSPYANKTGRDSNSNRSSSGNGCSRGSRKDETKNKNKSKKSRQYMKGVWWHSSEQRVVVLAAVQRVEREFGGKPVTTHCGPAGMLYRAEERHQKYYEKFKARISAKGLRLLARNHRQQREEGKEVGKAELNIPSADMQHTATI